jgi:hypothetical protein
VFLCEVDKALEDITLPTATFASTIPDNLLHTAEYG